MVHYFSTKSRARTRTRTRMQTDYSLKCSNIINQLKERHCDNGTNYQHIACLVQQCEKQCFEEPGDHWIQSY